MTNHITFLGEPVQTATYVLWLQVSADCHLSFGRYEGGRPVAVAAGHYAYIGSAMGKGGASPAGRLLRHATRTRGKPPHAIRAALLVELAAVGLALPKSCPAHDKRLRWHIDYLLDEPAVEIGHVTLIRAAARLESAVAQRLAAVPGAAPLRPGLGAGDAPRETHLLRLAIEGDDLSSFIKRYTHGIIALCSMVLLPKSSRRSIRP